MNKKDVLNSIKIIALGLVLALGISYANAKTIILNNLNVPPINNVDGPLNVGSSNQVKVGGLAIGTSTWPTYNAGVHSTASLNVTGVTATDSLAVWNNATVAGTTTTLGKEYVGGAYTGNGTTPTQQSRAPSFLAKVSDFFGVSSALAQSTGVDPYTLTVYGKTNLADDALVQGAVQQTGTGSNYFKGNVAIGGTSSFVPALPLPDASGISGASGIDVNGAIRIRRTPASGNYNGGECTSSSEGTIIYGAINLLNSTGGYVYHDSIFAACGCNIAKTVCSWHPMVQGW